MMLGLFVHSPSLRLQVFVHVHVKEHVFHRVHAVKRSSPDRHTRSRQVCHGPPCSVAPGRRNVSLFGPVRCAYTHDIAVFVIFGGILAPLGCMQPSRAHRSRLRYVRLRPSLTPSTLRPCGGIPLLRGKGWLDTPCSGPLYSNASTLARLSADICKFVSCQPNSLREYKNLQLDSLY